MKSFLYFLIAFAFFLHSCTSHDVNNNHRKYTIITTAFDTSSIIYGFNVCDDHDTLKLSVIDKKHQIDSKHYDIIIEKETKEKIIRVFYEQLNVDKFDSKRKESTNYSVIFRVSANFNRPEEQYYVPFSNILTAEYRDIKKNSDVSKDYEKLINHLKSKHKKFQQWPN